MSVSIVPRLQPIEVFDVHWPQVNAPIDTNGPGAFTASGMSKFGGAAITVWGGAQGAAGTMTLYREHIGALLPAGGKNVDGIRCYMPLDNALITAPGYALVEAQRVFRAQVMLAFTTANPTNATGICMLMGDAAGGNPAYPSAAGIQAGFGIQGDGAGGLRWFSKATIAGGFADIVAINMGGVPLTEVSVFDFELRGATRSSPATVRLIINGAVSQAAITRAWGAGTVLPTYALATPMNHMRIAVNSGAGETIFLGPTHVMAGRFTAENVELLNGVNGSL